MSRQDANAAFALSSFLQGTNAPYIDDLYARYEKDPNSVDADWQAFFKSLKDAPADAQKNADGPSWGRDNWPLTPRDDLTSALDGNWAQVEKVVGAKIAARAQAQPKGSDKASELVQELPFAARTSALVLDLKLLLLLGIYVHAFFRFTWAMRQYTFGALMIGAAPDRDVFNTDESARRAYAHRAARVMGLAAETFNDGLRAVYLSFAAMLWFLSPLAMVAGTVGVIWVLYRREFHSDILAVLDERGPPADDRPSP